MSDRKALPSAAESPETIATATQRRMTQPARMTLVDEIASAGQPFREVRDGDRGEERRADARTADEGGSEHQRFGNSVQQDPEHDRRPVRPRAGIGTPSANPFDQPVARVIANGANGDPECRR